MSWLTEFPIDWVQPQSINLLDIFVSAYPTKEKLKFRLQRVGLKPEQVSLDGAVTDAWKAAFEALASKGKLQDCVDQALKDPEIAALHPQIQQVIAPDNAPISDSALTERRQLEARRDQLQYERTRLEAAGQDTSATNKELLKVKRLLRSSPALEEADTLCGQYILEREIGRGGFATVWRAYDKAVQKYVAIKILDGRFAKDRRPSERFFRGARVMARLSHPNLVQVLQAEGLHEGHKFFVMELLEGETFENHSEPDPGPAMKCPMLRNKLAGVLGLCHHKGLIHRDIKPANVLLTKEGVPKLTDFDLVRAADTTGGTRTGALGTVVYAAPEALQDASRVGPTVDVYSLGMIVIVGLRKGSLPTLAEAYDPNQLVQGLPVDAGVLSCSKRPWRLIPKCVHRARRCG